MEKKASKNQLNFTKSFKERIESPFDIKAKKTTLNQGKLREIVSDLNYFIKTVKYTKEPLYRYIIPSRWLKSKLEALNR